MGGSGGTLPGRARSPRPRGNIETLRSGALRVRVYAGTDILTGRELYLRELVPPGPKAHARAEKRRDELLRQVEQGRHARTNATVRELLERHLTVADVEPRTLQSLRGYLRNHIAPLIGDRTIGALNAVVLDSFYAELRRCRDRCDGGSHACRPLAAWTIRKIHYLLSAAYENAIRWEWVAVNPMDRARKPAPPAPDPCPPTPEQAALLVSESWRRGFGEFVWLAMTTGARRGELCALRWSNLQVRHASPTSSIDHDCTAAGCTAVLVIRRAMAECGGQVWEKDTKTHQRRHVALDPDTLAVLLNLRHQCRETAARAGTRLTDDSFVFSPDPDGRTPCPPSSISQRYTRCARSLGIATTLKNLRHYSATELITAGVDVRTVAGRLGHSGGGTTTLKVYAAWVAAADQNASTVLMNRMPQRPAIPSGTVDETHRAQREPHWPHEQVAATLHHAWQRGALTAGSELTVKNIVRAHDVSTGTGHRVISLLHRWGVVQVRNGRPSIVLPPPGASAAQATEVTAAPPLDPAPNAPGPQLLKLDLLHLGKVVRTLSTQADPHDFTKLRQLLVDAVRRTGACQDRIGEYELAVHLADQDLPLTTVVIAA